MDFEVKNMKQTKDGMEHRTFDGEIYELVAMSVSERVVAEYEAIILERGYHVQRIPIPESVDGRIYYNIYMGTRQYV